MTNSFVPPTPGERIMLLCTKCKAMFSGPNPGYNSPFRFLCKPMKKAKCPNCGSKRVIPYPWIHY